LGCRNVVCGGGEWGCGEKIERKKGKTESSHRRTESEKKTSNKRLCVWGEGVGRRKKSGGKDQVLMGLGWGRKKGRERGGGGSKLG